MTTATLAADTLRSAAVATPWHRVGNRGALPERATVIGAGIAGCCVARTLAGRGLPVTVIDAGPGPAQEASGNPQAILYGRWGTHGDALSLFNQSAYLHALGFYPEINRCGVLQLAWCEEEQGQQEKLREFFTHYPEIARYVTREEASQLAGVPVEQGGLFFEGAGWIHPAAVCKQLLQHPHITTRFNHRIETLPLPQQSGEAVVIATGHGSSAWPQTQHLPLKALRGQVSHGIPDGVTRQLRTVLSGDGYVAPALDHLQSFGATYTLEVRDLALTTEEHTENLEKLSRSSRVLAQQWENPATLAGGRAHFRATTPDTLPLCGPVPDPQAFQEDYGALRQDARQIIHREGRYFPHLYICAGLGSRGMVYAPLCGEVIASQILETPPPLPTELLRALSPARFVIRSLRKGSPAK